MNWSRKMSKRESVRGNSGEMRGPSRRFVGFLSEEAEGGIGSHGKAAEDASLLCMEVVD